MVISDEHRLIYFHIRKTAGTSIRAALSAGADPHPLCLPAGFEHETVQEFVDRIGYDIFGQYRSFCFVRHPQARFISQYKFLQGRRDAIPFMKTVCSVKQFIKAIRDGVDVRIGRGEKVQSLATIARPQHEYVSLAARSIAVDHVFRYEELPQCWATICSTLGIPVCELPGLNKSAPFAIDEPAAITEFVEDYYRRDFELFGYARGVSPNRISVTSTTDFVISVK